MRFSVRRPSPMYDWYLLHTKAKSLVKTIEKKWLSLLKQKESEETYHQFLAEHAGFFLVTLYDSESIVVSKLRLGADYVVDFIKTHDHRSAGIQFEFIELETPWSAPYTKSGKPSSRLVTALQQIENWKRWMKENKYEFRRLFPLYNKGIPLDERYKFTIIIGNRENSEQWLERRNQLAEELSIAIRSFDYLTDHITRPVIADMVFPHLCEGCTCEESNALANPFFKAYSNSSWRELVTSFKEIHRRADYAKLLLEQREYNDLFHTFVNNWCPSPNRRN